MNWFTGRVGADSRSVSQHSRDAFPLHRVSMSSPSVMGRYCIVQLFTQRRRTGQRRCAFEILKDVNAISCRHSANIWLRGLDLNQRSRLRSGIMSLKSVAVL